MQLIPINEDKVFIFKVKNIISELEYNILKKTFPNLKKEELIHNNDNKYSFDIKSEIFTNLIKKNNNLKILYRNLEKRIVNLIIKKLLYKIFKERKFQIKLFLKFVLHALKIKKNFYFSVQYSYIFNKGFIVPHNDGRKKLISFMLFMEEKDNNYGTTFFLNDLKSKKNIHINDQNTLNYIKNGSKIIKLPFDNTHLYGFIRNDKSWHSVESIDVDKNYVRKSININYNIL